MAYQPIENYAIIGNMRSAALVGILSYHLFSLTAKANSITGPTPMC